jgi:predicted ester cyclase
LSPVPDVLQLCQRGIVTIVPSVLSTILFDMLQVTATQLRDRYKAYLEAVNTEQWDELHDFLTDTIIYNGKALDKDGYIALIPTDTQYFAVALVVDSDSLQVAARLENVVRGVKETEHCFYQFTNDLLVEKVWTLVVDGEATGPHNGQSSRS